MSRELRRVPLDFDWPLKKVWQGYLMPDELQALACPGCGGDGYSARARHLKNLWYGYVSFEPEDSGSMPLTVHTPEVDAFARRNVANAPEFYGTDDFAVTVEAQRLATLWNGQWSKHLAVDDIAALVEADRLHDLAHTWTKDGGWAPNDPPVIPTPAKVTAWSISSFGHDSINAHVVIKARCEREGEPFTCGTCDGSGQRWRDDAHRQAHEAWESTEPPTGEGWQAWETTTEGSPTSPVFATPDELVAWAVSPDGRLGLGGKPVSEAAARAFVNAGWAPSMVATSETGVLGGVEAMGVKA